MPQRGRRLGLELLREVADIERCRGRLARRFDRREPSVSPRLRGPGVNGPDLILRTCLFLCVLRLFGYFMCVYVLCYVCLDRILRILSRRESRDSTKQAKTERPRNNRTDGQQSLSGWDSGKGWTEVRCRQGTRVLQGIVRGCRES